MVHDGINKKQQLLAQAEQQEESSSSQPAPDPLGEEISDALRGCRIARSRPAQALALLTLMDEEITYCCESLENLAHNLKLLSERYVKSLTVQERQAIAERMSTGTGTMAVFTKKLKQCLADVRALELRSGAVSKEGGGKEWHSTAVSGGAVLEESKKDGGASGRREEVLYQDGGSNGSVQEQKALSASERKLAEQMRAVAEERLSKSVSAAMTAQQKFDQAQEKFELRQAQFCVPVEEGDDAGVRLPPEEGDATQQNAQQQNVQQMRLRKKRDEAALHEHVASLSTEQDDLLKLETQILKLQELFFFLGVLADRQTDALKSIEDEVDKAEVYTGEALKELEEAQRLQESYDSKRGVTTACAVGACCCCLVVTGAAVAGVVLLS